MMFFESDQISNWESMNIVVFPPVIVIFKVRYRDSVHG